MADPLSLLRKYNVNKRDIEEKGDVVIFGVLSWPKYVKTNYMIFGSGQQGEPKEYYSLECLLFFLKNNDLPHPFYLQKARAKGISAVRRPDRKKLLAYLYGKTDTSQSIDKSTGISNTVKHGDSGQQQFNKIPNLEYFEVSKPRELLQTDKASAVTENIKSIMDVMTVERIAAIKAKRFAKKYTVNQSNHVLPNTGDTHDLDQFMGDIEYVVRHKRQKHRHVKYLSDMENEHCEEYITVEGNEPEEINGMNKLFPDTNKKKKELIKNESDHSVVSSHNTQMSTESNTDFSLFGKSVALQLQQMALADALELQIKIQSLLSQRCLKRMKKLNVNS